MVKKDVELLSVAHRGGRLEPFSSRLTSLRAQKVYSSASIRVLVRVIEGTPFAFIFAVFIGFIFVHNVCVCFHLGEFLNNCLVGV